MHIHINNSDVWKYPKLEKFCPGFNSQTQSLFLSRYWPDTGLPWASYRSVIGLLLAGRRPAIGRMEAVYWPYVGLI